MKVIKSLLIVVLASFGFYGCYTIISHPTVQRDDYVHRVKFYNDCSSCHSNSELIDYGYVYLEKYPYSTSLQPVPVYVNPVYTPPWWLGIGVPVENNSDNYRSNDQTRLRNMDGGRTSAPTDFSIPSRNATTTTGGANSSNATTKTSNDSSEERNGRSSSTPNSRNNSGERKK